MHRRMQRLLQAVALLRLPEQNIIAQRIAVQPRHLRGIRALRRCKECAGIFDGHAVPRYRSLFLGQQPEQRANQRGFARADRSRNDGERSSLQAEVNVRDASACIGEAV